MCERLAIELVDLPFLLLPSPYQHESARESYGVDPVAFLVIYLALGSGLLLFDFPHGSGAGQETAERGHVLEHDLSRGNRGAVPLRAPLRQKPPLVGLCRDRPSPLRRESTPLSEGVRRNHKSAALRAAIRRAAGAQSARERKGAPGAHARQIQMDHVPSRSRSHEAPPEGRIFSASISRRTISTTRSPWALAGCRSA